MINLHAAFIYYDAESQRWGAGVIWDEDGAVHRLEALMPVDSGAVPAEVYSRLVPFEERWRKMMKQEQMNGNASTRTHHV